MSIQRRWFWNKKHPLFLGNISGDLLANNMKKEKLNGCVYYFSFEYRAFNISDITNLHKHLIKNMI